MKSFPIDERWKISKIQSVLFVETNHQCHVRFHNRCQKSWSNRKSTLHSIFNQLEYTSRPRNLDRQAQPSQSSMKLENVLFILELFRSSLDVQGSVLCVCQGGYRSKGDTDRERLKK